MPIFACRCFCGPLRALTIHGYAHGNPATWILGDFYQVTEFAVLFVLAAMVVRTECQFRTIAHVIVGSIIATSALQIADVLTGASYLWKFHMARQHGDDLLRTINMNAPIAFVILLAALPLART